MIRWILASIACFLIIALAGLHFVAPPMIENSINGYAPHDPFEISEAASALHRDLFIADLHTDTMLWKRDILEHADRGHVDLPRLQAGNVGLQVFSATTKSPAGQNYDSNTADSDRITGLAMGQLWPPRTWGSIYERAAYQLEKLIAFADASNGELVLVGNQQEMASLIERRAAGERVVGAIYLIEGAHPLEGKLENLDRLYEKGLRVAGLTHFFDNRVGGSLHGISGEGLTPFGEDVIRRANELGIIIDIAHASPQMVRDILALSTTPVMLSHGGVKGVCNRNRNLDDDLMVEVAAKGGIIGIGYWEGAVCDISPRGVVHSIRYAIDLLGLPHVALGSDYDGATTVAFDTSELAVLTQTMLDEGFTEAEIRAVMGGNVQQFLLEHLPEN